MKLHPGILKVPLFLFVASAVGLPQDSGRLSDVNAHAWYMYFGDHSFTDKSPWGLHFDGQVRRQGIGQKWQQLLLRPGINYNFTENLQVSSGYAFIKSHPYGDSPAPFTTPEHRLWQQLIVKRKAGHVGLIHRYRVEQRFVGIKVADDNGQGRLDRYDYRNRFRYFLKGVIPVARDTQGRNKYYVGLYNEFMLNFGAGLRNNIFDQNRAYAALGFRLPRLGNLEIGYLQQTVQQGSGRVIEYNHTFQIGFFSNAPFRRVDD
jgi:hypothetical protein